MKQVETTPEPGKNVANQAPSAGSEDTAFTPVRRGNLIVLTGPSGVGKGTLTKTMLQCIKHLVKSVSVTTRNRRPAEEEGVDYFFVSRGEFEHMEERGRFLEFAEFAGNMYGTPKAWVEEQLKHGNDVLLEIEVQGAKQVRLRRPESLLIFVSPPSFESLRMRLEGRGTETPEKIAARLERAELEMQEKNLFYYEVVNDNIDEAVNNLTHIVYAERCRIRKTAVISPK